MKTAGIRLPDRKLLTRAALPAALCVCFAVAAGLGLYALSYLRNVLVHERGDHLTRTAVAVARTLDRVLFERYSDIQLLAGERLLREGNPRDKSKRLHEYKNLYRYYSWLGLTDQTGRLAASTGSSLSHPPDAAIPDWHTAAQDGRVHLIQAHPSPESEGADAVGFGAPVFGASGAVEGAVTSRVPLNRLSPILEQESRLRQGLEEPYDWLLLDGDGTVIIEKQPPAGAEQSRRPGFRSAAHVLTGPDTGFIEEIDQRRNAPMLSGYARTKGYEDFRGFDWIVVIRIDRDYAYAPIDRLIRTAGWIGLLIITPLTGFGIWASWRLGHEHHKLIVARRELEQSVTELGRSNAELQQFAYVASHDLQEPLRMVSSYTQLLGRRYKGRLDADADDFIAFAVDGACRMQQLIQDLLAYSRVSTRDFERIPVSLNTALEHASDNLRIAVKESGAIVTHDDLPTVAADERQLTRLFQNLLSNAIKFRGADAPLIHVSAKRVGHEWVLAVRDNGIGIDPQYADRIFVIFQRLHNREEYPGTGIGLAVCRKIVERHGGRMWVESEPGKGATFFFTLPDGGQPNTAH